MKMVLVCGAAGFIGGHLVARLKQEGCWVRGADRALPQFSASQADDFAIGDLRDPNFCAGVFDTKFDEVYQLAAEMGGAEYIYAGVNDAEIMSSSLAIDLKVIAACRKMSIRRIFFASSACVYPRRNQARPDTPYCAEDSAYPADPDSEYGWTKLFSERLYLTHGRHAGIEPRIARLHNVFGPCSTWFGGREKAPAALCRKVAEAPSAGGTIEIIGDGKQTRSFLFISEAIEGVLRLTRSAAAGPINLGSEELVSIDRLADMIMEIAGRRLAKRHVPGRVGVAGRNSDNRLIRETLGWAPSAPLRYGLEQTYAWIESQVRARSSS
jgi:GDP-D-mannose 3',5'-epimerase